MDFDEGAHNVVIIFDKLIHVVIYQYLQLTTDIFMSYNYAKNNVSATSTR